MLPKIFNFFGGSPKWVIAIGFGWTLVQIDEKMGQEVDVLGPGAKKLAKRAQNGKKPEKQIEQFPPKSKNFAGPAKASIRLLFFDMLITKP